MVRIVRLMAAVALLGWIGSPASAAISLQPGEWQDTTTGTEDGKAVPPEVEKSCMPPEEARDAANIVKQMKEQMQKDAGQCQKFDAQERGNTVVFAMQCGDLTTMSMDIAGTFTFVSSTHYTGTMKSTMTMGGKAMTQDKKINSIRIGECTDAKKK